MNYYLYNINFIKVGFLFVLFIDVFPTFRTMPATEKVLNKYLSVKWVIIITKTSSPSFLNEGINLHKRNLAK